MLGISNAYHSCDRKPGKLSRARLSEHLQIWITNYQTGLCQVDTSACPGQKK